MDFYKRLNYSLGNEDWHVEDLALKVSVGDTVVCITASGDRPLHLLMTDCKKIISFDMNPAQNYLLELKMVAMQYLEYEKYLAFLGCKNLQNRSAIFNEIKKHLSHDAAIFWEKNSKMIKNGFIYQGAVERRTHISAKFFKLIRGKKIETLLSFTDLEEQRSYLGKYWDTYLWRKIFEIGLNSTISKLFYINDPGLNSFIDPSIKPGKYIYDRMNVYLNSHLAQKSALFQLVLKGSIDANAYFPYLTFEGYDKIRKNMDRLSYFTGNIIDFLNANTELIDCFSMSDIASYMPQEVFEKLLEGIYLSAKPKARFCLREFLSKRYIPNELAPYFNRDFVLEQRLENEESNFVYRFMAGKICKKIRSDV